MLTDASPNDEQRMAPVFGCCAGEGVFGDAGIEDAAMEVRQLKKQGIRVMAVFYGLDSDLEGARKIYGSGFVRDQGDGAACGYGWKFDQSAAVRPVAAEYKRGDILTGQAFRTSLFFSNMV